MTISLYCNGNSYTNLAFTQKKKSMKAVQVVLKLNVYQAEVKVLLGIFTPATGVILLSLSHIYVHVYK